MKQLTVLVNLLRVAEILGQSSVYLGCLQRNNKTTFNETLSFCSVQRSKNTHKDSYSHTVYLLIIIGILLHDESHFLTRFLN